jgi:hypothetical protein
MMLKLHEWSKNFIFKWKNYVPHLLFHVQIVVFRNSFFRHFRSFVQFQHHNIASDKWSDQNNERFYHVKQTVENRRPSKMGDVATLLFVHFIFIIQLQNIFLFPKSRTTSIISRSNCSFSYFIFSSP